MFFSNLDSSTQIIIITVSILALAVFLLFYFLRAFGIYRMAQKRKLANLYLAFIPFVNYLLLSKVAGSLNFFGKKTNKYSYFYMSFAILSFAFSLWYLINLFTSGIIFLESAESLLPSQIVKFNLLRYASSAMNILYLILSVLVLNNVYRRFAPQHGFIFTFIGVFFYITPIFLFIASKNEPKELGYVFFTARNPNNPYNTNPYNTYNGQTPPKIVDPFEEFKSETEKTNTYSNPNNSSSTKSPFDEF